jgi:hypothetical protein
MIRPFVAAALSAVASFSLTVSDIRPYVDDRLWTQDLDSSRCSALLAELGSEVTDILDAYDANGYLEPALFTIGITGHWLLFGNPGEEIQILSETLPFLPASLQNRLKTYLSARIRAKNPLNTGFYMVGNSTWGANPLTGNRRERYVIPTAPDPWPIAPNLWPSQSVPPEALYQVWRYCEATGDYAFASSNMSAIHSLASAVPAQPARYGEASGLIGYCRLMEHDGLTGDARYTAALNKIASGLTVGVNFSAFLDSSYGRCINKSGGHDWSFSVFHAFRVQPAVCVHFAPEIGRFLKEHALADVRKRVTENPAESTPGEPAAIESHWPQWYLFRGEYPPIGDYTEYIRTLYPSINWYYGENHTATPDNAFSLFMVHAYAYEEAGDTLLKYVDVPACRGDLYHISRLLGALRGFGSRIWCTADPGPVFAFEKAAPFPGIRPEAYETSLFRPDGRLVSRSLARSPQGLHRTLPSGVYILRIRPVIRGGFGRASVKRIVVIR